MMLGKIAICISIVISVYACAVMPADVTQDAALPFPELIQNADRYRGKTVIVGGYVVEVSNEADQSRIIAVQTPLGIGQEPKSRDSSQGRLVITYQGFIDPEVFQKERKITVAGKIIASSQTEQGKYPFPYLHIDMTHIHLWPVQKVVPYDPYWDYWGPPYWGPPYYYRPWGWRHPYWC